VAVGEAAKRAGAYSDSARRQREWGWPGTGTGDIRLWARYPAGPARQVPVQIFEAPAPNSNRAPPRHVHIHPHPHPHPPPPTHSAPIHPSYTHCNCALRFQPNPTHRRSTRPHTTATATMATVPVSEVKSNARESRTAAHSHIKGLGLSSDGRATPSAGGFIGQAAAREVCLACCTAMRAPSTDAARHAVSSSTW
jgi:hypothetical protein